MNINKCKRPGCWPCLIARLDGTRMKYTVSCSQDCCLKKVSGTDKTAVEKEWNALMLKGIPGEISREDVDDGWSDHL